jgi:GATA-binding protein
MDWRAKSQSRSRSRAPEAMDWRAQSRSRSRAPDFRVSVAPPTVDATTATANFSRFYGDNSSTTTSTITGSHDSRSAHVQLAASLGLSLNADMYNTIGDFSNGASPDYSTAGAGAGAGPVGSQSFAFPPGPASPDTTADPNLAAIENTLNQLISLQSLAAASNSQTTSPTASTHSPAKSPTALPLIGANAPASFNSGRSVPDEYSSIQQQQQPHSHRASGDSAYASLAQQQLQQLASVRAHLSGPPRRRRSVTPISQQHNGKISHGSSASASPLPRPPPLPSTSPYMNAATLAQSSRPFSFASSPASGLSLGRPPQGLELQMSLSPTSASYFSEPPTPFSYPSSAPGPSNGFFHSPVASIYGGEGGQSVGADSSQFLYDYFQHQVDPSSGYSSPYLNHNPTGSFDNSATALTHVNPSHLLNHLQQVPYDTDNSSWGVVSPGVVSAASGHDSSRTGTSSPPDGQPPHPPTTVVPKTLLNKPGPKRPKPTSSASSSTVRTSANSPDLVGLGQSSKSKAASAPASRVHSRSNTLSVPPVITEGKALALTDAGKDTAASSTPNPSGAGEDALTKCLNCSTTVSQCVVVERAGTEGFLFLLLFFRSPQNTPLWRRDTDGRPLCNACGLFRNLHGVDRPANLNTGVIKVRFSLSLAL